MRRMAMIAGLAALTVGAVELSAQAAPNFAGKWTMVVDPNAATGGGARGGGRGGGGMFGLGQEATITQDAKTLTITRTIPGRDGGAATTTQTVYNLDGTDSKNTMAGRGGAAGTEAISKAKVEGGKLMITTALNFGGNPFNITQTMSMDASGQLIVESTTPGRDGGAGTTTKSTYKKG